MTTTHDAVHDLGQATYNMRYADFRAALGLEDDAYARDKYAALKSLARALTPFTDSELTRLTEAYTALTLAHQRIEAPWRRRRAGTAAAYERESRP
jgi:hypothetical protein